MPPWPGRGASSASSRVAVGEVPVLHRPELETKVRDVVGLYLDPPAKALVLCVDERSPIQALNRTAPMHPTLGVGIYVSCQRPLIGMAQRRSPRGTVWRPV
jgi:hypothetical protein